MQKILLTSLAIFMLVLPASAQGALDEDIVTAGLLEPGAVALQEEGIPTATEVPTATLTLEPTGTGAPIATPTPALTATNAPPTPTTVAITGIEPREFVQETGGMLSIYGSGFVPGIAVRLIRYGLLDAAVVNQNAIRTAIPPGLPEGSYTLEVILPDGKIQAVGQSLEIHSGLPTATSTPVSGPARAYNQPQLLIETSTTDPAPLHPGGTFLLKLNLVNRGDYTATNIRVALSASAIAVPAGGSSLSVIDTLQSGETASLELPLALSDQTTAGYHNLDLLLNYSDYYRREFSSQQSIGVSVGDNLGNRPLVLMTAYSTNPGLLSPGDTFSLKMKITNVGQSDARQVLLTLGGEGGAGLTPFAILSSGNIQYVPVLHAGDTVEVEQRLILDGSADAGVFPLSVTLAYDGPDAARLTGSQVLNLITSRRPQLRIDFYRPLEPAKVGQPAELPIELINIGRSSVNISTVVISGDHLEIAEGSFFIGALDGGTSGTIDTTVTPLQSGVLPVNLTINYLDDFNQPQVVKETLTFEVEEEAVISSSEAGETSSEEGNDSFWERLLRIIRGLFGLGS